MDEQEIPEVYHPEPQIDARRLKVGDKVKVETVNKITVESYDEDGYGQPTDAFTLGRQ